MLFNKALVNKALPRRWAAQCSTAVCGVLVIGLLTLARFSTPPAVSASAQGMPPNQAVTDVPKAITPLPNANAAAALPMTPDAPESVALTGQNLVIQSLSVDPPNPAINQPVTITIVVRNAGSAAVTETFGLFLYIDPADQPPTTTTTATDFTVWGLGLNPNATFTYSYVDYTFASNGAHPVYAWVDRANRVPEDNETDNVSTTSVQVGQAAEGPDSYEPQDNACTGATPMVTNGVAQTHNFLPNGDVDWVKFNGQAGVEYVLTAASIGANADASIGGIYATCTNPADSLGGSRILRHILSVSGTYFVKLINRVSATSQTSYTIAIAGGVDCSGFFEPNDSNATAQDISVGNPQAHRFCTQADEDWVKFSAQAGVTYTVQSSNAASGVTPVLAAYDVSRTLVATGTQSLQFSTASTALYYIQATNLVSTTFSQNAVYSLSVSSQACAGDGYEPDNSRATAQNLIVNLVPQRHNFCPAGDVDFTKFTAQAGVTYTIETLAIGSRADTVICLRDNIGTTIACDDEGGVNGGSRIVYPSGFSGEYTIETRHAVTGTSGNDTAYDISVVTGLCRQDVTEPDNTAANATPLTVDGVRQSHTFCAADLSDDRDWVRINIPTAGVYTMRTSGLAAGSDTILNLYDNTGNARLSSNDDYAAGLASQIVYTFATTGTHYVEVRGFNPSRVGGSTGYNLVAQPGIATPEPTPGEGGNSPTPTPTPQPSGILTLILTNRERLSALYGATRADEVISKLNTFAALPSVRGEVMTIDGNPSVAAAYASWVADSSSITSTEKTNQVADAVRSFAMTYLNARASVQYVMLIGDDRVIPMRRVLDRSGYKEDQYRPYLVATTTVGSALYNGFYLTDDYYVDKLPDTFSGQEVYVPDYGIGRLIETPEQIIASLDTYATVNSLNINTTRTHVNGWDFVWDVALSICNTIASDIGSSNMDCAQIGESNWDGNAAKAKMVNTTPTLKLQSANGHAVHTAIEMPGGVRLRASEIMSGSSDLSGGLLFAIGCHSGLNVPETSNAPLDLPEAYAFKRMNYIGNTGFGLGDRQGTRLSERVAQNFSQEIVRGAATTLGRAWMRAKQRYWAETESFGENDEKVMQQWVLYGFPMFEVISGATLGPGPFPSADVDTVVPPPVLSGPDTAAQGRVNIRIQPNSAAAARATGILAPTVNGFTPVTTTWGTYFTLDGQISTDSNGPIQPQVFANVQSVPGQRLRGALLTSATFFTLPVDPLIASVTNEYLPVTSEPAFQSNGFYPPVLFSLQHNDTFSNSTATLAVALGQYDSASGQQRLFNDVRYDTYFSASTDTQPPTVRSVDGFYNTRAGRARFKVEATDRLTVTRVLISYIPKGGQASQIQSVDLTYTSTARKWMGEVPSIRGASYFVQSLDSAGNATSTTRKGGYFGLPDVNLAPEGSNIYLPLIRK